MSETNFDRAVCVSGCGFYDYALLRSVLEKQFYLLGVEKLVKPGMKVAIKPNLLTKSAPEEAVVTHPLLIAAAANLLQDMGAQVLVAESPGGPYTPGVLKSIYTVCGYTAMAAKYGVELNMDCSWREYKTPEGKRLKAFNLISPILDADFVVDMAKLKTHCMTGMSAAVKNLFGTVPGLMKPELHCRFPGKAEFGEMLAELCLAVKPGLCIVDAVTAMEGNGPHSGNPRFMGALVAGRNAFAVDVACAELIHMKPESVWMLKAGMDRGCCPASASQLEMLDEPFKKYVLADFVQPESRTNDFIEKVPKFLRPMVKKLATPIPKIHSANCIGCGKCAESCPQHTIVLKERKAVIDYSDCIRCYCCQEMCPAHAIDIKRFSLFNH